MDLRGKELQEEHLTIKFGFIQTELDLALTFCDIAISSHDKTRSTRNEDHAHRAYNTALHFLDEMPKSTSENRQIRDKLARLKKMLGKLHGFEKRSNQK